MLPIQSEADLSRLSHAARVWVVLQAWNERGLLTALDQAAPRPLSELDGEPRALDITARILAAAGILVRHPLPEGDHWGLSGIGRTLLHGKLRRSAWSTLGDYSRLDQVLAHGGPVTDAHGQSRVTSGGVRVREPAHNRAFMDTLHGLAQAPAQALAELVCRRRSTGRVLDLGGGHGRYGRVLADQGFDVTLFDRPHIVPLARERHGDALAYREGDFFSSPLGRGYDLVLLCNIVHGLGPSELDELLARIAAALEPGGLVLMQDMFLDDSGVGPLHAANFGLTMLYYTQSGQSYSTAQLGAALQQAGFGPPEITRHADLATDYVMAPRR